MRTSDTSASDGRTSDARRPYEHADDYGISITHSDASDTLDPRAVPERTAAAGRLNTTVRAPAA